MKETKFTNKFVRNLRIKFPYMWDFKVHGHEMQKSAIPDNLFCIDGAFISIEFKIQRDSKIVTTPMQVKTIEDIRNAGGVSLIIAYDENRGKILVKSTRIDWRKLLKGKHNKVSLRVDWDFEFSHYEPCMDLLEVMIILGI